MGSSRNGILDAGAAWKQQGLAVCLDLGFCKLTQVKVSRASS